MKINIEILKEAMNELRAIKDGKGKLRIKNRISAMNTLRELSELVAAVEKKEREV